MRAMFLVETFVPKRFLKLTSKSEVEVGGVNTVAAPEVEGA